MLTQPIECEKIYQEIDWVLLLMFVGLFVVVAGLENRVLTHAVIGIICRVHLESVPMLSTMTAVLSNLFSYVPAVLVLRPFVSSVPNQPKAWLTIAMASTLAGNLTLPGVDCESYRGAMRPVARGQDRLLGLFQGWCAAYSSNHSNWGLSFVNPPMAWQRCALRAESSYGSRYAIAELPVILTNRLSERVERE